MFELQLQSADRGLTPVIGIILLVSITVLLAATTAAFVFGLDDDTAQQSPPTVAVAIDYDAAGPSDSLQIMHRTGGSLDPDQTVVVVDGATCTGGDDPNGRYVGSSDFGVTKRIAAGMSLDVEATLDGPTALCSSGDLKLDGATVSLVWESPNGRTSDTISTWSG